MAKTQVILDKLPIGNTALGAVNSGASALKMLIETHHEYKKIAAQEKTKRQAIEAWKEVRLTDLKNQKEILQFYLQESFKERRTMLNGLFDSLDKGLESGNIEAVNLAISGIINISKDSPLAQVDKLMIALKDEKTEMIEF